MIRFPRAAFKEILAGIIDPAGIPIVWDGDPVPFVAPSGGKPGAIVTLGVRNTSNNGVDEVSRDFDAATTSNVTTYSGNRLAIVSFVCDSYANDLASYDILETIRLRFRRASVLALLREVGFALVDGMQVIDLDATADNRVVWKSTMDLRVAYVVNETDVEDQGGIISTVDTTNLVPGTLDK